MAKYIARFTMYGEVEINAESTEEANESFSFLNNEDLYDHIEDIELSELFEDEDE